VFKIKDSILKVEKRVKNNKKNFHKKKEGEKEPKEKK